MPVFLKRCQAALLLAVVGAAGAQTAPTEDSDGPPRAVPGRVLSDVQASPAEERDSAGAVLLDDSRVRAQKDAQPAAAPGGVQPPIGRNAARVVERTRSWADVRDAEPGQVPAGEASGAPR
jgi:hypothetical protein